jgi:hypothetical protein
MLKYRPIKVFRFDREEDDDDDDDDNDDKDYK